MAVEPAAPWELVPAEEQLFVLVTGANSGVGLGTAQRLVDEFLATRSRAAHLVLVLTTRSPAKSRQTVREVRAYAARAARRAAPATARATGAADDGGPAPSDAAPARVHVLSLQLDLCDLRAVRAFARQLAAGRVGNPDGLEGDALRRVRVPRLDCVVFNAAYGGWTGCDYLLALWSIFTRGLVESVTWPTFKKALPTSVLNEQPAYRYPLLGEVFAACVFGHYVLAHELLPLLSRPPASGLAPARIIWSSSLEAVADALAPDDVQCLARPGAYESAKRLTDVLVLTRSLPAARPLSSRWLSMDGAAGAGADAPPPVAPRVYVTHPGIVASTIFPVPWFLFWAYELALVLSRWLGSPWHTVDAYTGAAAAVWVALQGQDALDAAEAERVKWGSAADRRGRAAVKKTEVDGWGWEGRPADADALAADPAVGILRMAQGRRRGVADVTQDDIVRFEELGARCWRVMEAMRVAWDDILDEEPA